jgi:hypothetical protein
MGKLKEKLLNNLTPEEMDDQFELSAFEYVELLSKYKDKKEDESYPITEAEIEDIERMVEEYYQSKEFQEQADGWTEEMEKRYWEEQPQYPFATQNELDEINDSLKVKFTEDEVIEAIKLVKNEDWFINRIRKELNGIWNRKNGVF